MLKATDSVIPKDSKRMILVIANSWDDFHARLYLCESEQGQWTTQKEFPAVCGKKGMSWGIGVYPPHQQENLSPIKREGDLKSPAGIFQLGQCMGYAPQLLINPKLAYTQLSDSFQGVDDQASKYYNQIIDISTFKDEKDTDWKSFEKMKRKDDLYKWLVIIKHNPDNIPGAGSLIFLHLWKNENSGTAGCTAVAEKNMLEILKWLDMSKKPVLAQLPKVVYDRQFMDWGLPPFTIPIT